MVNRILILLFLSSLTAACGRDNSHAAALPTAAPYRLQPGELVLAASPEDIPPIQAKEEDFVPAQKADLDPEDLIVGIFIGGESKVYPVRLLNLHEVVNDRLGEETYAVTWCPLCYSPVVYRRVVAGQELSFQASGYLLKDNLVLVDQPTGTLWSQLLGQGIRGALRGEKLEVLPSQIMTWENWREIHPESLVLDDGTLGYAGDLPDPYQGYFSSSSSGLGGVEDVDPRMPGKSLVYGFREARFSTALPVEILRESGLVQFELGSDQILAVFDPLSDNISFYRFPDIGEPINFMAGAEPGTFQDEETGTIWSSRSGAGLKGPLKGEILTRMQAQLAYWFAWSSFYPDTDLVASP